MDHTVLLAVLLATLCGVGLWTLMYMMYRLSAKPTDQEAQWNDTIYGEGNEHDGNDEDLP